ncbi:TRAP transporter substrate-binding protein [uncultured Roseibium sp.]|uniref:TRAP transporter substrate-binding protein n=1 Tax=uncultured Roseibium sp. TaxID=1936171 RepID=UPI00261C8255|nr:TRAP transporter substrate-binding protein [uncultured Roseibium sp.]
MNLRFRIRRALSAVAFTTLAVSMSAAAADTWNMPVPYGDNNFHTLNHVAFAKDVEERTNGDVKIVVHPSGSLFKHPEIKNAVRSRQAPLGEFLLSRLSNENPIFGIDSVPFLATSYDDSRKLWDTTRPAVEDLLGEQGLMVLYAVPWPPQGLYANRDVNAINDLSGLKFRAYNAATERLAQLASAVPTQVEVADLGQAFSTGRVDAMVTSPSTGYNSKAWDYLSNYYDVQAWLPKNIVVMNKRIFDALDDDTKAAVLEAAKEAETRGWAASMGETEAKTKGLADNGIKVAAPSDALKGELVEIGQTMTQEWLEQAGDDGKKLIDAYNQ